MQMDQSIGRRVRVVEGRGLVVVAVEAAVRAETGEKLRERAKGKRERREKRECKHMGKREG